MAAPAVVRPFLGFLSDAAGCCAAELSAPGVGAVSEATNSRNRRKIDRSNPVARGRPAQPVAVARGGIITSRNRLLITLIVGKKIIAGTVKCFPTLFRVARRPSGQRRRRYRTKVERPKM